MHLNNSIKFIYTIAFFFLTNGYINFVTYYKKESHWLRNAKSSLDIVENTLSKPPEILESKTVKQREIFPLMFHWNYQNYG